MGTHLKWGYYERLFAELKDDTVYILWPQGGEWPLPATCVFLAFAFPFQAFPLPAADEGWHGGIAVFSSYKQINNKVVTCPPYLARQNTATVKGSQTRNRETANLCHI